MKSKEQAQQDAGARISQSAAIRARHRTQLSHPLGQIVVDTPDRVLKRLARLKRYASDAAILESTSTGVPSDTSERLVEIQELEEAVTRVLLDEPNSAAAAPSRVARSAAPGNVAADHDEMQRFQRRVAAAVGVPSTAAAASPRQPRGAAPPAAKMQSPDASGAGARSGSGDAPSTDAASRQGTLAIALERVFFSNAFLDISYLSRGVTAEEAVVHIQWDRGGTRSYGTGFLVAPGIVLTNEHVLPERELADIARIRFRYEEPDEGAVSAIISTRSVPEQLFLTSTMLGRPELDFTLVAVNTDDVRFQQIAPLALIAAEGKAVMGDHLTVVQHPNGGFKRIALRNNSLAAVLDTFLHYETGTEGGSSGSPVFNDQWEVVALHHASVRTDREQFEGWVNEGVRVSSLIAALQGALSDADRVMPAVASPHRARLQALVTRATAGTVSRPATPTAKPISDVLQPANVTPLETRDERTFLGPTRADQRTMVDELSSPPTLAAGAAAETSLTVPLTITVRLGTIGAP
ncbi:MAG: trypsin-like peptidase domain-containing protein, partial [Gemmatimonas sp.]